MDGLNSSETANNDRHPQTGPEVVITINNKEFRIHRGRQTVVAIKTLGGVPLADDLEERVGGQLQLLPDDGAVTIKGGEVFISHPKDSGSSCQ
jgi:hypothetical protein